jgi:hypothetical protein
MYEVRFHDLYEYAVPYNVPLHDVIAAVQYIGMKATILKDGKPFAEYDPKTGIVMVADVTVN